MERNRSIATARIVYKEPVKAILNILFFYVFLLICKVSDSIICWSQRVWCKASQPNALLWSSSQCVIQDEKSNDVLSIRTIISQKSQFAQGWSDNALILIQIAMILKRTLIVRWKNLDWIGSIDPGPGNILFFKWFHMIFYWIS